MQNISDTYRRNYSIIQKQADEFFIQMIHLLPEIECFDINGGLQ